jgi:hypothetical protein
MKSIEHRLWSILGFIVHERIHSMTILADNRLICLTVSLCFSIDRSILVHVCIHFSLQNTSDIYRHVWLREHNCLDNHMSWANMNEWIELCSCVYLLMKMNHYCFVLWSCRFHNWYNRVSSIFVKYFRRAFNGTHFKRVATVVLYNWYSVPISFVPINRRRMATDRLRRSTWFGNIYSRSKYMSVHTWKP